MKAAAIFFTAAFVTSRGGIIYTSLSHEVLDILYKTTGTLYIKSLSSKYSSFKLNILYSEAYILRYGVHGFSV